MRELHILRLNLWRNEIRYLSNFNKKFDFVNYAFKMSCQTDIKRETLYIYLVFTCAKLL